MGKDLHSDELALSMAYDCTMLTFLWEKIYTRMNLLCPWLMTYDANLFVGKDLHSDELQIHCFIIKTYVVNENISSICPWLMTVRC